MSLEEIIAQLILKQKLVKTDEAKIIFQYAIQHLKLIKEIK